MNGLWNPSGSLVVAVGSGMSVVFGEAMAGAPGIAIAAVPCAGVVAATLPQRSIRTATAVKLNYRAPRQRAGTGRSMAGRGGVQRGGWDHRPWTQTQARETIGV